MKTTTAITAYTEAIQQLKTQLGDAQRAEDIAKTHAQYYQDKYEKLMADFLQTKAENTMLKLEVGRGCR